MFYNLCLFDLDGTLTDPKPGITRAFQYALSAFGIQEELDGLAKFIGPPLRETIRQHYGFSSEETEKAVAVYREYFSQTGLYENAVYPEIPNLLQRVKDGGAALAVATSKVTLYTNQILDHFGLGKFFDFVSGDEMDGSLTLNGKRNVILNAINALDPERALTPVMIGDRMHDIRGARDAGIDSVGVLWGYGSRAELEEAGATRIAETPEALLEILLRRVKDAAPYN